MKEKCKDKCKCNDEETICTDPQGSYTGVPVDEGEEPVQDVDDL